MELFIIPVFDKYIIYRPLRRLAFVGNRALAVIAQSVAETTSGVALRLPESVPAEVGEFLLRAGFLEPDPPPPPASESVFQPTSAVLLLTNRCQLRCVYCYARAGTAPGRTLDWQAARAVIDTLSRGSGWVYLWGPPGLGKTLVLKIAVAEMLRRHKAAAYTRMAELIDHLRSAFDARDPSEEAQRRLDWWAGLPLLAIDEFDRVRNTEYSNERRFLLLDRRYEQALNGKSITIMAANADPATLEPYLYDRIRDGRFTVVKLEGDSARPGSEW